MITHIRVKNFKSWEDSDKVELAPLTGFFGTNSSGKSSLLQMLLLLKQTVDSDEFIFFGDENSPVNLGSFREVIHGHKEDATLGMEFGCKLDTPFTIEEFYSNKSDLPQVPSLTTDSFTFNVSVLLRNDKLVVENNPYCVKVGNEKLIVDEGSYREKIYGSPIFIPAHEDTAIRQLSFEFRKLFKYVYPLGPIRIQPKRSYHWDDKDPTDVGLWGNKVIDALLCAHMRRVKISKKGEEATIEDRISEWLREMDLAYSFSLEPIGALKDDNYEVRIQKSATSPAVTLADMGYGLADVLPMLVLCYYTPKGSILILEQPGIHLHPKAQADLADLLIEVITDRNLQILIESHSEHLLTRLQLRIAEQKITANETALYFCENENGVSTIKSLDVDDLGNIKNWPKDFFGNVRGDLVKMTREQMKRQKKVEG